MKKATILIIDDQKENLVALEQSLQQLDAHIITASSGKTGVINIIKYRRRCNFIRCPNAINKWFPNS